MEGWIKLHRAMLDWEWWDKPEMVKFFLHCLLKANFEEKKWRGVEIKRGQLLTSLDALSAETRLSKQTVRTCIARLKSTQEITHQSTRSYTIITISKYDSYQQVDDLSNTPVNTPSNTPPTHQQHTSNTQLTPTKEVKKEKNKRIKEISISLNDQKNDHPEQEERERILHIFFFKKITNPLEERDAFWAHYEKTGWLDANGNRIVMKMAAAKAWKCKNNPMGVDDSFYRIWSEVHEELGPAALELKTVKFSEAENALKIEITKSLESLLIQNDNLQKVQNKFKVKLLWKIST